MIAFGAFLIKILGASVSFGTGETDQMHTKEEVWLYDEDENNVKAWDW